jgi:hypothetical protein
VAGELATRRPSEAALLLEIADRLGRIEDRLERLTSDDSNVTSLWLDKRACARELGMSVRWLEDRMADGLPHRVISGKPQFRLAAVESWLRSRALLREVS